MIIFVRCIISIIFFFSNRYIYYKLYIKFLFLLVIIVKVATFRRPNGPRVNRVRRERKKLVACTESIGVNVCFEIVARVDCFFFFITACGRHAHDANDRKWDLTTTTTNLSDVLIVAARIRKTVFGR